MFKFLISLLLLTASTSYGQVSQSTFDTLSPKAAMIEYSEGGGGSGVILKSTSTISYVLSNKHVCEGLLQKGGSVKTSTGKYIPQSVKMSEIHDLCAIVVSGDMKVKSKVSEIPANLGEVVYVAGHPRLEPVKVISGNMSTKTDIELMAGVEPCTEQDFRDNAMLCMFVGGLPILKQYEALSSSLIIAPGNSGSGVFNEAGEIVALVFASSSREYAHGFLVPSEYIRNFLMNEYKTLPSKKINRISIFGRTGAKNPNRRLDSSFADLNSSTAYPAVFDLSIDDIYFKVKQCLSTYCQ